MIAYYHQVRREIQPLLPERATRILDIGSGAGGTLGWLRTIYPRVETTGVELNPQLHEELKGNADIALIGSIDECSSQLGKYDLILLLDVLEHLPESITTLQRVRCLLESGGRVIVSVPNVAHLSVSMPLLVQRRFRYEDAGILDRTHLRFFVEETAVKLLNDAGLVVTKGLMTGLQGPRSKLLNRLSFGLMCHHLARQYIMLGEIGKEEFIQRPVRWKAAM